MPIRDSLKVEHHIGREAVEAWIGGDDRSSGCDTQVVELVIRSTSVTDLPDLGRLWNDGSVMGWVGFPGGLEIDGAGLASWFAKLSTSPDRHHFVIREPDGAFLGELYYRLDQAGRASLDIKLVPSAQGRGIATQALTWLIATVFRDEPSATMAWTEPSRENVGARALYSRCGLRPEARPPDLEGYGGIWAIRRAAVVKLDADP